LVTIRQKNFQERGATKKTRPKNSTSKPPSTLSVPCMKIQGDHHLEHRLWFSIVCGSCILH